MITFLLITGYIISAVLAYKEIRKWCIYHQIKPKGEDVLFVSFPLVNLIAALKYSDAYDVLQKFEKIHGRVANKCRI